MRVNKMVKLKKALVTALLIAGCVVMSSGYGASYNHPSRASHADNVSARSNTCNHCGEPCEECYSDQPCYRYNYYPFRPYYHDYFSYPYSSPYWYHYSYNGAPYWTFYNW